MKYRVEDKYLIYEDQIAFIETKLREVCKLDPNMKGDSYLIRSIYFDDYVNSCMAENESGVDSRSKYRIRAYDNDKSFIRLEKKGKKSGFTSKESVVVDEEFVDFYLERYRRHGGFVGANLTGEETITENTPYLIKDLFAKEQMYRLSPVNIVEYERRAYVEPVGNVRITFDRNIGYTTQIDRFWENNMYAKPVLQTGLHIMEVKYDELIPDHIIRILNIRELSRTSFSKYYYSRISEATLD